MSRLIYSILYVVGVVIVALLTIGTITAGIVMGNWWVVILGFAFLAGAVGIYIGIRRGSYILLIAGVILLGLWLFSHGWTYGSYGIGNLWNRVGSQPVVAEKPAVTDEDAPTATEAVIDTAISQPATPTLTAAVTSEPVQTADGLHVIVNGVQMGVIDPQMQQTHSAAFYLATGITGKNEWTIEFPSNAVLIVGGFEVNGTSNGVYQAFDVSPQKVAITDGFALVTLDKWANWEFCFRVYQAEQYGWAHETVTPLSGWTDCAAMPMSMEDGPTSGQSTANVTATPGTTGTRQATGQNNRLHFEAGAAVWGWEIVLDNGKTCTGGDCYLPSSPSAGTVLSGVINPWPGEVPTNTPVWQP